MKKLLCVSVALTLLSACASHEVDLDKAADERMANRAEIRNHIGCQFIDEHDAYRRCVIATYENNRPKTFTTAQDSSGQPVVVVSNGVSKGMVYAEMSPSVTPMVTQVTEKTSVISTTTNTTNPTTTQTQSGAVMSEAAQTQVAVAAPVTQGQQIVHNIGTVPCDANLGGCMFTTQELYQGQMVPCPTCVQKEIVVEQPKIVTVERKETVVEKPLEVVPAPQPLPDKTWWETYQEEKQPAKPTVVCPCPDPNDPCPQCVTK